MSTPTDLSTVQSRPTFASIICGVDGSDAGFEAARKAAVLAGDGAVLSFVAVGTEQATSGCLDRARDAASALGVDAGVVEDYTDDPAARLLGLAGSKDLLVVGIAGHSRAGGILLNSVATALLHRSPVPVLVARRSPDGTDFPARIVLASDGTPMSDAAAELTARLAARHGAAVGIVGAIDHEAPFRPGLAEHATQIQQATGTAPTMLSASGAPHHAVVTAAREFGASLIVTGSRALTGASAIGSVSERVAHGASCSVLVVRHASADS
jgi:nucleotide-binding universal stress UspA family protein